MKPLFHIRDDFNPVRLFEIKNNGEEPSRLIELNMDEITSSSTLRKRLFGIGDYIWMARDEQLIKLLGYLGRVTETADPIKQLGWQREGFYAFCNGASEDGTWIPIDDMGILRLQAGKYYLPAMSKLNKDSRELYVSEKSSGMRRWLTTRQVSQTFCQGRAGFRRQRQGGAVLLCRHTIPGHRHQQESLLSAPQCLWPEGMR